uniref:Uncharacterized protein n=1 Tax=Arundo donax TaxID=35708 RepID=A0A0A9I015_ARUDO
MLDVGDGVPDDGRLVHLGDVWDDAAERVELLVEPPAAVPLHHHVALAPRAGRRLWRRRGRRGQRRGAGVGGVERVGVLAVGVEAGHGIRRFARRHVHAVVEEGEVVVVEEEARRRLPIEVEPHAQQVGRLHWTLTPVLAAYYY